MAGEPLGISYPVFSQFDEAGLSGFSLSGLWSHSVAVGIYSKKIAEAENQKDEVIANACVVGLLHDVGKVVLATNLPEEYKYALRQERDGKIFLTEAEQNLLGNGVTHAEVGAYLLGLWYCPIRLWKPLPSTTGRANVWGSPSLR